MPSWPGLLSRELVPPAGDLSPRPGALPLADVDLAPLCRLLPPSTIVRVLLLLAFSPAIDSKDLGHSKDSGRDSKASSRNVSPRERVTPKP